MKYLIISSKLFTVLSVSLSPLTAYKTNKYTVINAKPINAKIHSFYDVLYARFQAILLRKTFWLPDGNRTRNLLIAGEML